ncbi:MAG: hypothetical protein HY696_00240 [Deltaproteobacteria bacterium]|nr:hypothetical protein [Deltaproteobacteria bacterium]
MRSRRAVVCLLIVSLLAASVALYRQLAQEPYLQGTDAYYYALQAEYWAQTGTVKIPDSSVIHRVTGSLERAGLSGEAAVRVWEALSLCLLGLSGLMLLSRRLQVSTTLCWLALMLSPSALFLAIEFPKFFSMLLVVPLWFAALESARYPRTLALLLAAGSLLLHRAALPLVAGFTAIVLCSGTHRVLIAGLGVTGLIASGIFYDWIHWVDWQRLSFLHAQPGLLSLWQNESVPFAIKLETLCCLVVVGLCWLRRKRWRALPVWQRLFPAALCLPAFVPFGADEGFGVGERYALLLPALLWVSLLFLTPRTITNVSWNRRPLIIVALLAAALPWFAGWRLRAVQLPGWDAALPSFEILAAEIGAQRPPMLIARKDFVFFYKFRRMQEAFPYEPETHWDKTRVWRLTYAVTPEELRYWLPADCDWANGRVQTLSVPSYHLVREDCWAALRSQLVPSEDPDLFHRVWKTWLNPAQRRPAFLYPKHADDRADEFPAHKRD